FLAGLSGILTGVLIKKKNGSKLAEPGTRQKLIAILGVYLALSVVLIIVFWPGAIRSFCKELPGFRNFQRLLLIQDLQLRQAMGRRSAHFPIQAFGSF
ncbi:MAG TPA: hypothetical protein PLI60_09880, partial [Anaerolineaceae bacterium]|nr:hypothetical protein [Anaerolineaceae bacterium]